MQIPFNWPYMTGSETDYISEARLNGKLAGDGPFTKKCHQWIEDYTGTHKALLTHSCTAALEMAALLLDLTPGDEIIMPSYTFVSTANAFVLRGAIPVFVDIRQDNLNLDEAKIESAITNRTRAIVPVHYAGVSCEMDTIINIAKHHELAVIEDAAQGVMSTYKGKALGSIGDLGTYSFHETKNVISGEGGALLINNKSMADRAEVIREKGTDRSRFFRGAVDKYTWQDIGSSFLPGELTSAFLFAQLQESERITSNRISTWDKYHNAFAEAEENNLLRRPVIPSDCKHNAHMYYILMRTGEQRNSVMEALRQLGVNALFHYIPLHSSPAGRKFGRAHDELPITDAISSTIIRLPIWMDMSDLQVEYVINSVMRVIEC
jgi:dTDP-4-amino-4,6-dideoxygalactose transaminase